MKNKTLNIAKKDKFDEFYTKLTDIEKELTHYKEHFKNKTIYCNCDDPQKSNFTKFFELNFEQLGLKKLISTNFNSNGKGKIVIIESGKSKYQGNLDGNGDFRSNEAIELLKEADIVVTNPPFSLLREYIKQLFDYSKKFLIVANINLATCKEIFPLIKENKMWLGYKSGSQEFAVSDNYNRNNTCIVAGQKMAKFGNICWLTNLDIKKRYKSLILCKTYNEKDYQKYDNYQAIEVKKVAEIPLDYNGAMGVPITFLYKHNPEQFDIIGADFDLAEHIEINGSVRLNPQRFYLNNKRLYSRIIIRRVSNKNI